MEKGRPDLSSRPSLPPALAGSVLEQVGFLERVLDRGHLLRQLLVVVKIHVDARLVDHLLELVLVHVVDVFAIVLLGLLLGLALVLRLRFALRLIVIVVLGLRLGFRLALGRLVIIVIILGLALGLALGLLGRGLVIVLEQFLELVLVELLRRLLVGELALDDQVAEIVLVHVVIVGRLVLGLLALGLLALLVVIVIIVVIGTLVVLDAVEVGHLRTLPTLVGLVREDADAALADEFGQVDVHLVLGNLLAERSQESVQLPQAVLLERAVEPELGALVLALG